MERKHMQILATNYDFPKNNDKKYIFLTRGQPDGEMVHTPLARTDVTSASPANYLFRNT
jgi:hypothetical protein